jgi:hypothetical protein
MECLPVMEPLGGHHELWRVLALLSAARHGTARASEGSERLTRELESLRLKWGEMAYDGWLRRPDVRALLAVSGLTGGERR